jgi:hypothetical protein
MAVGAYFDFFSLGTLRRGPQSSLLQFPTFRIYKRNLLEARDLPSHNLDSLLALEKHL